MDVFLQTLEGWVYIVPIHGPLYIGSHVYQHPPQSELPAQQCSRLDNKKANTPPHPRQPQLATCYVEAGAKLREGRGG